LCGIVGFIARHSLVNIDERSRYLSEMTDAIKHRGPDSEGAWVDPGEGVALGHRRLAILDLSSGGAQPMRSADGRFVMIYNGEIYNHLALRAKVEATTAEKTWRGTSDTETLIEAIALFGLEEALRECCGMFALAVWDRKEKALTLARDNLGEKPLYYTRTTNGFVFASELKALCKGPDVHPRLDRTALQAFLSYGYVPEGFCIMRGVSKLKPGYYATFRTDIDVLQINRYQGFESLAFAGPRARTTEEALEPDKVSYGLERLLKDVVSEQMLTDVPLGCFLSGGVDSSLVASLMQAQGGRQTRTFSIGFRESKFNEAPHAAKVAAYLKTDHTEFQVSEDDALGLIPALPDIYDEPFADSSQIPTALLCREARKSVTVALTGDGADEIFGGYNRHIFGPRLWRRAAPIPKWLRASAGRMAGSFDSLAVNEESLIRRLSAKANAPITAIDKATRLVVALGQAGSIEDLYAHFSRAFSENDAGFGANYRAEPAHLFFNLERVSHIPASEWMMAMDAITYLPGDILVKVDRAAMHVSLETRAPFIDPRVVRAAWALPSSTRTDGHTGKVVLRKILYRYVPRELIERPKQGFSIPLDRWLRGALRPWAESLLERRDLLELADIKLDAAEALWGDHIERRANNGQKLWVLLTLISWLERYADILDVEETFDRVAV
jgi:asparagine synthase (glutamine-hydrolysing)